MTSLSLSCDIAIVGGGVAGLWLLHRLKKLGYNVLLCEQTALGAGQTICSQGILHGGIKYAFSGDVNAAALNVNHMPAIWTACINGSGPIDLQGVSIVSPIHYVWTMGKYTSIIKSLIARRILHAKSKLLSNSSYPNLLKNPKFLGSLFSIEETVLDIPSLLSVMHKTAKENFVLTSKLCQPVFESQRVKHLRIATDGLQGYINAQHYIFAAGAGNETLLKGTSASAVMQRRSVHMTWLKFPGYLANNHISMHCVEHRATPSLTITSHRDRQGSLVWYIGGNISEDGTKFTSAHQIDAVATKIHALIPWLDLEKVSWRTALIERAEALQPNHTRPDNSSIVNISDNLTAVWPTKLVLAPELTEKMVAKLNCYQPRQLPLNKQNWPTVPVAQPLWWN